MKFLEGPPKLSPQSNAAAGLLGVDIPDTKLDRYSVMFSGLLDPAANRSSLYERRQSKANADHVKPLEKIAIKVCIKPVNHCLFGLS